MAAQRRPPHRVRPRFGHQTWWRAAWAPRAKRRSSKPISKPMPHRISATTQYRAVVQSSSCASANSSVATITVNPVSVGGSIAGSATVCTGTNSTTLSLSGHTGTVVRWQSSTDNFSNTIDINNTTNGLTVNNLSATTQYRAVVQSGSCTSATSNTATITVNPVGTWIGGPAGDWNNAANWCGGIPTAPSYVSIPAGSVVSITSGTSYATAVHIAPGAQLIMSGAGNLSVSPGGTFVNNGSFDASASTTGQVIFTGNGTISGTITFNNLSTAGALDFGIASTVSGEFTLNPGGSVTGHSPYYACPGSALIYAGGVTFARGLEWTSATSGAGYPSNVHIRNNTRINFPVVGPGHVCNDLVIDAGSALYQNFENGSAPLTVARDVNIAGTLALGAMQGGDINVGRHWTRSAGGVFTHNNRSVYFTGSSNAIITAPVLTGARDTYGAFGGEAFYRMYMNKQSMAAGISLGSPISIVKELGLVRGTFNVSEDVTMVSNDTVTAAIAPMTSVAGVISNVVINYTGAGKFNIQRHLAIGGTSVSRRWRLLSSPVQATGAPTISEAWQYGVSNSDRNAPLNPWPGFGTTITKSTTYNAADGYDQGSTNNPSIYYPANTSGTFAWSVLPSTKIPITNYEAYFLFARGSRNIVVSTPNINANPTILEARGRINTGDVQKSIIKGYQVFGNPYAAAINFSNLSFTGLAHGGSTFNTSPGVPAGVGITYYVWDPKTSGSSNVGKWITCSSNGDGTYAVTGNTSGLPANGTIESGSAFMLNADATGGTVTFHENDKLLTSSNVGIASRGQGVTETISSIHTNLLVGTGAGAALSEGVISSYHSAYRNQVDGQDATGVASFNTSDALRIASGGKQLVIERRNAIADNDTIFLRLVNVTPKQYMLQINTTNIEPRTIAVLEDKFKGTATPINLTDTTSVAFEVTSVEGSGAVDRFRIVFKSAGVLPVTFKTIKAVRQQKDIAVEWTADNEQNVAAYELERSPDGRSFDKVYTTKATGSSATVAVYNWLDANVATGDHYYRVKSLEKDNSFVYSKVVKVSSVNDHGGIHLYPNPVLNAKIGVQMVSMAAGNYQFTLVNSAGQTVYKTTLRHNGGSASLTVAPNGYLGGGHYQLLVTDGAGYNQVVPVMISSK